MLTPYNQSSTLLNSYPQNRSQNFLYSQNKAKLIKRNKSLPRLYPSQRKNSARHSWQRGTSSRIRNVKLISRTKHDKNLLTKQVLQKSQAKQKIAQLQAVLNDICQNGFDEAYFCNQQNHASKLIDEFTQNLISAVQKLVSKFKNSYTNARRSKFYHTAPSLTTNPSISSSTSRSMFSKNFKANRFNARNPSMQIQDSQTTATTAKGFFQNSSFHKQENKISDQKFQKTKTGQSQEINKIESFKAEAMFDAAHEQQNEENKKSKQQVFNPITQVKIKRSFSHRNLTGPPTCESLQPSFNNLNKNYLLNRTLMNSNTSNHAIQNLNPQRTLERFNSVSQNFYLNNTITFDIHLYQRYLMLLKKGKRDAAKSVKDLMTNSLSDLRKITEREILNKKTSISPRNVQTSLDQLESEFKYGNGIKFSKDQRIIEFASRSLSPGPATHNQHPQIKIKPGGFFSKDMAQFDQVLPSSDNPPPGYYKPIYSKASRGLPTLVHRGSSVNKK